MAVWGAVFAGVVSVGLGILLSWRLPKTTDRASPILALAAILFLLLGSAILVRGFGVM
jgi:hypothetical protein